MELLQLRYFYESAKNGTFAKTAEKYNVPAASVSASIKRLEKDLGCKLFNRTSNRITLNDNGKSFMTSISAILNELDQAVDKLAIFSEISNINLLVRAMRGHITDYIIEYKKNHPQTVFKTVFNFDEANYAAYDIIIDELTDKYEGYEYFELCTTPLQLCVSPSSTLCGRKLTLMQLSKEPFISIGENNSMTKIFMNACKRIGFIPNIIVQSNDLYCCHKFVEADIGIIIDRQFPNKTRSYDYNVLDVIDFNEKQTICVYYKKHLAHDSLQHFLNFLKSKNI